MQRKPKPLEDSESFFVFDVLDFESLIAIQIPFVVLPGQDDKGSYVVNLASIRELIIESSGMIRFRFKSDLDNKWNLLSESQSQAFAEKVHQVRETIATQIAATIGG